MKACYSLSGEREEGYDDETNDCVVRAFKNVLDITYSSAHSLCQMLGRKEKQGVSIAAIMSFLMNNRIPLAGYRAESVYQGYYPQIIDMRSRERRQPLYSYMPHLQQGRYLVLLRSHVTAVIDGVIHDCYKVSLSFHVFHVWRFVELE